MHRPVLVRAPEELAVSLEAVKRALRVDFTDDDEEIRDQIRAATQHYNGWTGILGICLVEQEWRQDFDRSHPCMALPLGPVTSISQITVRNAAGQISTISSDDYSLNTDAGGRSFVRWRTGYTYPCDFYDHRALSVTYKAGWAPKDDEGTLVSTVPLDLQAAIKLRVQLTYDEAARDNSDNLERAERDLISKYRRMGI